MIERRRAISTLVAWVGFSPTTVGSDVAFVVLPLSFSFFILNTLHSTTMAPSTPDSFSEKPEEYFKENATTQDIEFSSTTAPAAAFSAEREKKLL